ncbi:MAG: hypothetical protein JW780_06055 [Clostridiales bacterium]|nr:hypothetical protein [Clostridiales bacterium]
MSAFIVSNETMNKVIAGFEMTDRALDESQRTLLVRYLYRLNTRAVNHRYHDHQAPPVFTYTPRCYSLHEIYKALQCLRYQCSNGQYSTHPLIQELFKLELHIANEIISHTKEYENAKWD